MKKRLMLFLVLCACHQAGFARSNTTDSIFIFWQQTKLALGKVQLQD